MVNKAAAAVSLLAALLPVSNGLQVGTVSMIYQRRFNGSILLGQKGRGPRRANQSSNRPHSRTTSLNLLKGLVPTVDDDIRLEMDDANQSSFELLKSKLDEGCSIPEAMKAVMQRRKDKAGDYENKYKILSDYRSYSNKEMLDADHYDMAPTLDDLNQEQPAKSKIFWVTSAFRLGVFLSAFFVFPLLCNVLNALVEVSDDEFDIINEQFTPGIGILYGTFVALTLDILYERQGKVQENASVEASLLSQVTQNVLNLFRDETEIAREATQIIADQVRIIVYRSRGSEMLSIMRADPYARLLSIVDHYQRDAKSFTPHQEALIDGLRGEIPALMEARAKRLSDEASALPPTHFLVLLLLTALSLIGFTAATLTITDEAGNVPLESRMVFAGLSAVYVLFFNFCKDMNDPFDGVYQIKRSSAASYLLQIKWLIANQPFGSDIKFDTRGLAPVYDGNQVDEIGKKAARKVEASSTVETASSKALPEALDAAREASNESTVDVPNVERLQQLQQELARLKELKHHADSIETSAPASIIADTPKKSQVEVAIPDTSSAKAFLPERKK